jgi:hypothetical protein
MKTKIGHASQDETSKAKGGKAGDQTAKEVTIRDWYLHKNGWTAVLRAKDSNVAEKIAKAMEQACANDNIGYDQSQRTTLFEQAEKLNWNLSKINHKCECDCSSLVAVCVNAAGLQVSKNMYTGNMKEVLLATKAFNVLSDKKYLSKADYLKRGDILIGQGHTAIVLGSNIESAKNFDNSLVGKYTVTATKLNIRCGAGITKNVLVTIPKGTEVSCYGYYTKALGTNWLYVQFIYNNKTYIGYASSKYLSKHC